MSRKKHSGGHGGAWKVAYADFMTAMMALFMVLWIIGQSQDKLEATANYFKYPELFETDSMMGTQQMTGEGSIGNEGTGLSKSSFEEMKKLADSIMQQLNLNNNSANKTIDIFVTPDGLRILLYNLSTTPIFTTKSKDLTAWGSTMIRSLAWTFDKNSSKLNITLFDPLLKSEKAHQYMHNILIKKLDSPEILPWDLALQRCQSLYRNLFFHGLTVNKLSNIQPTTQIPENARYKNTEIIEFELTANTLTLKK